MAATFRRRPDLARLLRFCVAAALFAVSISSALPSQDSTAFSTLRGAVLDSQGKHLAGVVVHLQTKDIVRILTAQTDSDGRYVFQSLPAGVYTLRARMAGFAETAISDIFLRQGEKKDVDLTLLPAESAHPTPAAPQFFDQPQFTVSGVTDTTTLGGHGADTVARTRETLAKETVSLGQGSTAVPSSASTENSLRQNVQRTPHDFAANYQLGKLLVDEGKAKDAIPYLQRAAEVHPDAYDNAYELALANLEAGNPEGARERVQVLLLRHDNADLHHLLADTQERLGNSLAAVREYQRATELNPSEQYLFDWGAELLLHHAAEPAVDVFTEGNRLFPGSVRMLIGLGAAWFGSGSYDQAVRRLCEASDLQPDDPAPYAFLGKMQNAEAAPSSRLVETLHRFAVLRPENASANYYYAVALWKQRKTAKEAAVEAQVEDLLNTAVRLDPHFAPAHLQLGILHSEQADFSKAITNFEHAVQSDPLMEEAHYRLAQAYREAGETDKAKAELTAYDRLAKESAQRTEKERRDIRQFVYTLRDQPPAQK